MPEKSVQERVALIVSCFMAVAYLGGGIFLITSSLSFGFLAAGSPERYLLAVLLVLYGLYRGYRAWAMFKS